eukprot:tig00000056_g24065.t1
MQRAARCRRRLREREAAPPRDSDAEEYEALQELSLRLLEEYDIAAAAAAAAAAPEPPAEPPPGPPPEPEPLSAPPPARASSCSLPAARAAVPCTVTTPERSRSGPPAGPASAPGAPAPPPGRSGRWGPRGDAAGGEAASYARGPAGGRASRGPRCGHAGTPRAPPALPPAARATARPSARPPGERSSQIFPEQAVLCGSEHVSTSNVIVADRSGERLRLTFWRAGAAWAQRLWPGDVLQVFSVALKEWQGQVTGNVGRASDARVLRRLRTGPERAPEPYGRPLHPPPDPEVVDGLATWAAEHHAPLLRPAAGPPRPRPPPRGPVDFAPSLAALQPDTLLHVRVRVLAAPRLPQAPPPASGQSGRRRRLRVTVVVADTPDRPVCLHLWEEGVARLLPLLCPGTLVELQYLQCRADPHLPAGRPHLHCTPRTAAAPLSPADPAAARLVAAFGPPPFVEYPSLAALPPSGLVRVPALVSFLRLPDDVPWTGDGFGVDDEGVPAAYRAVRAACPRCGRAVEPCPEGIYGCGACPPPLSAEEAVRWEFRPAFALLSDSDPSGGDGAPHPPPLRALLRPAALAGLLGDPSGLRRVARCPLGPSSSSSSDDEGGGGGGGGGWRFPQGRAAYEAASASVAARAAALRGPGVRPALLQLAVRARVDGAGFPLEHSVEVLGAEEGAPAPGPGERTLNA